MNRLVGIRVDCANVRLVAQFWAKALGAQIDSGASRDRTVLQLGTERSTLQVAFRRAPEGKYVRNRVGLDVVTDNFELETARLLSLGAIRLEDFDDGDTRRTIFADIEGNEFNLIDG